MENTELLESLISYVPAYIVRYLNTNPAHPPTPSSMHFPAAVLYAEFSELGAVVAQLADQGEAGVEKLKQMLNAYYWQLVDEIITQGGDMVALSGSAVLAIWPVMDAAPGEVAPVDLEHKLTTMTHRAAQCALSLRDALHDYQAAENIRVPLTLGVNAGEVTAFSVGGALGRWEFLFSGQGVTRACELHRQARPGEVLLSPRAHTLTASQCVGERLDSGGFRLRDTRFPLPTHALPIPPLKPTMESTLRTYIPGAVLNNLATKQLTWLADVRPITVLSINLPAINYTTPLDTIQDAMRALQSAVYHYAGSVSTLSITAEGMVLVAAFGLPPVFHEDDATRGVGAAMLALETLREKGIECQIGVATGDVFCGTVGSPRRREYTMIGEAAERVTYLMRLAAAEDAAPILCDSTTYEIARPDVDLEAAPQIGVREAIEPVGPVETTGPVKTTGPVETTGAVKTTGAVETTGPVKTTGAVETTGATPLEPVEAEPAPSPAATVAAKPEQPWEPQPRPAADFHETDARANINRAPYDQVAGVVYKRAMSIKRVEYAPADVGPAMPEPWRGSGPAIVRWLFSEQPGTKEHLLDGARFAFLQDTVLEPGASIAEQATPGLDRVYYVISGSGMLYHRPTDGSPIVARPLHPGDAALVRGSDIHSVAAEDEALRLMILGLES